MKINNIVLVIYADKNLRKDHVQVAKIVIMIYAINVKILLIIIN
jgi:hypothetical protein